MYYISFNVSSYLFLTYCNSLVQRFLIISVTMATKRNLHVIASIIEFVCQLTRSKHISYPLIIQYFHRKKARKV